jgi:putative transposon-encoded protein
MTIGKRQIPLRNFTSETKEKGEFPKVKFEAFGEEMVEKEVKPSGKNGRVYLPPEWVGKRIKIIRID